MKSLLLCAFILLTNSLLAQYYLGKSYNTVKKLIVTNLHMLVEEGTEDGVPVLSTMGKAERPSYMYFFNTKKVCYKIEVLIMGSSAIYASKNKLNAMLTRSKNGWLDKANRRKWVIKEDSDEDIMTTFVITSY